MKLSIIIPVYHEEKNIEKVIEQISAKVKTPHEMLVVFDTKEDPTYAVVRKFISKYKNLRLVQSSVGTGRGVLNAIKTGIHQSRADVLVIVMADLSDDIKGIDKMYTLIQKGYDLINGSRYMRGGKKNGGPFVKSFLSKAAGLSLFYIFKVPTHDATNAFKMYRKRIFDHITIESTGGFEYSMEVLLKAHKLGYRIAEIPTTWSDRQAGKSNFKLLKWLPKYLKWYVKAL